MQWKYEKVMNSFPSAPWIIFNSDTAKVFRSENTPPWDYHSLPTTKLVECQHEAWKGFFLKRYLKCWKGVKLALKKVPLLRNLHGSSNFIY